MFFRKKIFNFHSRLRYLAFSLGLLLVHACAGTEDVGYDHDVLSRSKEELPVWVKYKSHKLKLNASQYELVSKSFEVLNLALGIKTTQLEALDKSRKAFTEEAKNQTQKIVDEKKIVVDSKFWERVESLAIKNHNDTAKVADIYFERYQSRKKLNKDGTPQDLYKVFVLVTIPSTALAQVVAASTQGVTTR